MKGFSGRIFKKLIRVIGIHKEGSEEKEENYGNFIYPLENIINVKIIYLLGKFGFNGKYIVDRKRKKWRE